MSCGLELGGHNFDRNCVRSFQEESLMFKYIAVN